MIASATEPGSQTDPLLSTQSAAANNARATDRACAVVRYSSWSADSHTPTSPLGFCTAATSAEKPSSPRRGGQCGPKWRMGPVSPSGCSVWHQLGQVVDFMLQFCDNPKGLDEWGVCVRLERTQVHGCPWQPRPGSGRPREAADIDQDLNPAQDGLTLRSIRGHISRAGVGPTRS